VAVAAEVVRVQAVRPQVRLLAVVEAAAKRRPPARVMEI
jgi:hypothetical protein